MLRVLSSFQRTDSTATQLRPPSLPQPPSGEPFEYLTASCGCQPLFSSRTKTPVGTNPTTHIPEQSLRGLPPTGDLPAGGFDVFRSRFSAQGDFLSTARPGPSPRDDPAAGITNLMEMGGRCQGQAQAYGVRRTAHGGVRSTDGVRRRTVARGRTAFGDKRAGGPTGRGSLTTGNRPTMRRLAVRRLIVRRLCRTPYAFISPPPPRPFVRRPAA